MHNLSNPLLPLPPRLPVPLHQSSANNQDVILVLRKGLRGGIGVEVGVGVVVELGVGGRLVL